MKTIVKTTLPSKLTDNQIDFLENLGSSVKNLFPNVRALQSLQEMSTELPNGKIIENTAVVFELDSPDFKLYFTPTGKRSIELYKIEVYKQGNGIGTRLMKLINEYSLETRTTIFLRPVDYKNTTIEQLRKFYKSFSYKRCDNSLYWSNIEIFK